MMLYRPRPVDNTELAK